MGQPGQAPMQPGQMMPPTAMSYPSVGATPPSAAPAPAYGYPGYPNVIPQATFDRNLYFSYI